MNAVFRQFTYFMFGRQRFVKGRMEVIVHTSYRLNFSLNIYDRVYRQSSNCAVHVQCAFAIEIFTFSVFLIVSFRYFKFEDFVFLYLCQPNRWLLLLIFDESNEWVKANHGVNRNDIRFDDICLILSHIVRFYKALGAISNSIITALSYILNYIRNSLCVRTGIFVLKFI